MAAKGVLLGSALGFIEGIERFAESREVDGKE